MTSEVLANVSCVAVGGRGLVIAGPPGSGKSTLALSLIDRGAVLVGDDGVTLALRGNVVWAMPPPNIRGLLEVSGVGLVTMPACEAPVCLVLELGEAAGRLPEPGLRTLLEVNLPTLAFSREGRADLRAEWALRLHGLVPSQARD